MQRAGRGDAGGRDGPGSGPAGGAVPHAFSGIGRPAGGGCGELRGAPGLRWADCAPFRPQVHRQ